MSKNKNAFNQQNIFKKNGNVKRIRIVVSATFTSDPIEEPMIWWGKQFGYSFDIHFTNYNQVFQELTCEDSLISTNNGINLLLIRFEDWIRDSEISDIKNIGKLDEYFKELIEIIKNKYKSVPYFVAIFPVSTHLYLSSELLDYFKEMYIRWKSILEKLPNAFVIDLIPTQALYAIDTVFDPIADREGHIPFTLDYYSAMGTIVARKVCAYLKNPFKVIALDCDNTLWNGIVGEDGPLGIKIDKPYKILQEFMMRKYNEGFLLALCSKNNEMDVWEVFDKNPEMILKKDHFVHWKINWNLKSANLNEIARELNLGIDTFVFIDDSPLECAEVMTNCPSILSLKLPEQAIAIPYWLEHIWAFDKVKITAEDTQRTHLYKAEKKRSETQKGSKSLAEFLENLELKVSMNIMKSDQAARVSQLTQRTNQFNLSTIRRKEDEIVDIQSFEGYVIWVFEVSDKFGDYGLVGVVITKEQEDILFIDTMLLSCRAMGRGVENALVAGLRKYCEKKNIKQLKAIFYPTLKNKPILEYLRQNWQLIKEHEKKFEFVYPLDEINEDIGYIDFYYLDNYRKHEKCEIGQSDISFIEEPILQGKSVLQKRLIGIESIDTSINWTIEKDNLENLLHTQYMLPLECFPVKRLRSILSDTQGIEIHFENKGESPRNIVDLKLLKIWESLLKVKIPFIDLHFFSIGGNSLKAVTLISEIHRTFGVQLTMNHIFNNSTVKALSTILKKIKKSEYNAVQLVSKKEYYPLSSAQKRLFLLCMLEDTGITYNIPMLFSFNTKPDYVRLGEVLQIIVKRQESLRTSFEMWEGEPIQRIHNSVEVDIEFNKIKSIIGDGNDKKTAMMQIKNKIERIMKRFIRPFDLSKPPLFRVGILEIPNDTSYLMVDMHHIISDGISYEIFKKELSVLYDLKQLPSMTVQYKDYSAWHLAEYGNKKWEDTERYWIEQFSGEIPVLNLPLDFNRPPIQSYSGNTVFFNISSKETEELIDLARKEGTTLFMLLSVIFNILLFKLTGQVDLIWGTPVGGRLSTELDNIIGMFVNTLAIRTYPHPEKQILDFLREIRNIVLNSFDNQDFPFEELVSKLNLERDVSRNPLFDVMFVHQNMAKEEFNNSNSLKLKPFKFRKHTSRFDWTLFAEEMEGILTFEWEYCTQLFKENTINRYIVYFKNIVSAIIKNSERRISQIEIISDAEKIQILYDFNDTESDYNYRKSINEIINSAVKRNPDSIALSYKDKKLSFKELDACSNSFGKILIKNDVRNGSITGILIDRSLEMIIGIMSVIKVGGVYLPISPNYPEERIEYLLKDSGCMTVISLERYFPIINAISFNGSLINLKKGYLIKEFDDHHTVTNCFSNIAYVIYTSGSTGRPKGVLIRHVSVINLLLSLARKFPFSDSDAFLFKTTFLFDVSVSEIFGYLLGGGRLSILENDAEKDPLMIISEIEKEKITHINFVPSMFGLFLDFLNSKNIGKLQFLKYIFLAGEAISQDSIRRFKEYNTEINLENLYGPTEVTVYSSGFSIKNWNEIGCIPIGKPLDNLKFYITTIGETRILQLQSIGILGELCVSGVGLAAGYLNRPELTFEKFIKNPFINFFKVKSYQRRVYKTGDIVKWLSSGDVEYLGRIDHQVKIRGFRIETGEIEGRILAQTEQLITDAFVMAQIDTSGEKYLCAYIKADLTVDTVVLRNTLEKELPDYMIPSFFIQIDSIPLNQNGKLDRNKLPDPHIKTRGEDYSPPRDQIEKKLVESWSEILKLEKNVIGIDDNFFKLGGHSLKAAVLTSAIHKVFNVKLFMHQIFMMPTIRKLGNFIENAGIEVYTSIEKAPENEFFTLSPGQKRLYLLGMLEGTSITYNMPTLYQLDRKPNVAQLEKAIKQLIIRQESFRTSFEMIGNLPKQKIHQQVPFGIDFYDLKSVYKEKSKRHLFHNNIDRAIEEVMRSFVRPFDLTKPPLLRVGIIQTVDGKYLLMIDMHHIISDGISFDIFKKELTALYEDEELNPLSLQYKDFSEWLNKENRVGELKRQEMYWLKMFEDDIPLMTLPLDFIRPSVQSFEGNTLFFKIGKNETRELKKTSTLFLMLSTVFNILLWKLSGQLDIVVGTTVAGRTHPELENLVGMFVNTLAIRVAPKGSKTFFEFLAEVRQSTLEAFENQDYPFEKLVEKLIIERDVTRNPLFDVMFTLQIPEKVSNYKKKLSLKPYRYHRTVSRFDMTLFAEETEDGVFFEWEYCTKLFARNTIERFIGYYNNILNAIIKNSQISISDIEIMGVDEKNKVLYKFNETLAQYPNDKHFPLIFEEQAKKNSHFIATISNNEQVSYKEMNERANRVAHSLKEIGLGVEQIAAIMVERSIEMVIGIYGVLKAGGAYLPIEPNFPVNRIEYILEDSHAKVILTRVKYKNLIKNKRFVLNLDEVIQCNSTIKIKNPPIVNSSKDIAYIIYTSGSTGIPKGVMINHFSLINRINWMQKKYSIKHGDVILHKTTFVFDVSVWELFWWSFSGATQFLLHPGGEKDPAAIITAIEKNAITVVHFVPSMLNIFLSNIDGKDVLHQRTCLKTVFASGEALSSHLVEKFNELINRRTGAVLVNLYGPTEATVDVSFFNCPVDGEISKVPIGKPIDNTKLLVVDFTFSLQVIGVSGELCITGDQLARGYLNRPELTSEKFINNPFNIGLGWGDMYNRIYLTGDLVRWCIDGNIEYLGRIDHQVKIRGFRIETGEIENQILINNEQSIKEALVIDRADTSGERYLCAYIVGDESINTSILSSKLLNELPEYMIPTYFVQIDEIPLTNSGKADRKKLPIPQIKARGESYCAPRDMIEDKLAEIWAELLNIKKNIIGIDDNFFKLGGHSLKAAVMITTIHKQLDVKVSMQDVFNMSSIRKLSRCIKESQKEKFSSILPVEKREYYPLTPPQQRLYFMDQLETKSTLYNMQLMDLFCKGFEKEELEEAVRRMIKRHESLRTSFCIINGEPVQKVHNYEEIGNRFKVEYYESDEEGVYSAYDRDGNPSTNEISTFSGLETVYEEFVRPFDLKRAPLLRVGLVKVWGTTRVLILDMHHIVSDGISMVILLKELWQLYWEGEITPLRVQYKDFALWIKEPEQLQWIHKQEKYWLTEFGSEVSVLNLPYDKQRPAQLTFNGDVYHFQIGRHETGILNKIAQVQGVTMYMVLLAVFNVLLSKLSGLEDIVVGTATAGRGHADIQPIIGMFVETLVLRTYPEGGKSFKDYLKDVKKNVLMVFENQDYPLEALVKKVATRGDKGRNPLFDVVFLMENEAERSEEYLLQAMMFSQTNPFKTKKAKFDMTLVGAETADDIQFNLEYNDNLFCKKTIERFVGYFTNIINAICSDINQRIFDIDIISTNERLDILYLFNDTEAEYPKNKTITELIEEQTEKAPGNISLVGKTLIGNVAASNHSVTYKELNSKSNQLAHNIRAKGILPDHVVAIMVEPSLEMIIAVIGVVKSGGVFLPIDHKIPNDRIHYMLKESGTDLLLTQSRFSNGLACSGQIIEIDNENSYNRETKDLNSVNNPNDLVYIIYTSGSTGKPKGVMIEHSSLINLCYWHNNFFSITEDDRSTKYASFGFDASIWEIFPYLLKGSSIYIVPDTIKLDINELNKFYIDNSITISFLPTQMCEQFMNLDNNTLRIVLTGGDKLKSFQEKRYQLYNNYGPTENTIVATTYLVKEYKKNIPIGLPVSNSIIYIVDRDGHYQPSGVPGELCVGGDSVARGYMNNPFLTKDKFIDNPYKSPRPLRQSPRLYKTGDSAKWLEDGNIEFLGRMDYQVKVRGYRIELGEIENQLIHVDGIYSAIVIAREDNTGQKYLCAYIVSDKTVDIPSIKKRLAKGLPEYMLPSYFVALEKIPLNPSGKIDRNNLPVPEVVGTVEYAEAETETEKILVQIWAQVLGIEIGKIGIDDNFFELGGDSIKVILISGRLLKYNLNIAVNDFFAKPTIREVSKHVQKIQRKIEQGMIEGVVQLTPIQHWFFANDFKEKHHFNHVVWLKPRIRLDKKKVKDVFMRLLIHHDALRMVYEFKDGLIVQINRNVTTEKLFELKEMDFKKDKNLDLEKIALSLNRSINLSTGPMLKLCLFHTDASDLLLIVIHHLIVDGVSWRILLDDFETCYSQLEEGQKIILPEKTDSFKYWAQRLNEYSNSVNALKELNYWAQIEQTQVQPILKDNPITKSKKIYKNREVVFLLLNRQETEALLGEANVPYNTEINDLLLTALGMAVSHWTGMEKVAFHLEGHGREAIMEDLNISRTIGWFTSQFPVVLNMKSCLNKISSPDDRLANQIQLVKATMRRIPNKGIGYGILKYLTDKEKIKELNFILKPEISFNYHGKLEIEKSQDLNTHFQANFSDSFSPKFPIDYALDIIGIVEYGKLKLSISYNKYEFKRDNIKKFVEFYKQNLMDIIIHCVEKKKEMRTLGITPVEYHTKKEIEKYEQRVKCEAWPNLAEKQDYKNILLTGATGFLGAHLVFELLETTTAQLYLPVRPKDRNETEIRLGERLNFYFGDGFYKKYKSRLHVLTSELSQPFLGMEQSEYTKLCSVIDAVIHSAANVRHHGLYEELYRDNVQATENILEFALDKKKKDFHHVSTLDVGYGEIPGREYNVFSEYNHDVGQQIDHIYLRSKLEAEKLVLAFRNKGLNASIYRVGNLIFHTDTGKFQKNIGDDYFYAIIKAMIKLEVVTDTMERFTFDMSFINYIARSMVSLLTRKNLTNETYHLCNPHKLSLPQLTGYLQELGINLKHVNNTAFSGYLVQFEGNPEYEKIIERLKLHTELFEKEIGTQTNYMIGRTVKLLELIGINWTTVNKQHIEKMLSYCKEVGFL